MAAVNNISLFNYARLSRKLRLKLRFSWTFLGFDSIVLNMSDVEKKSTKLIAPSILSADFANLEKEVRAVASAGADFIHVDVMDGHFVPNLTLGAPIVKSLKKVSPLPLDVHLMIEKPEKYIADFIAAGADILTLHVESTNQMSECLQSIRQAKVKTGITLRPKTSLKTIEPYLAEIDLVLVMTVEPGFGGQSFILDQVDKIEQLFQLRKQNGWSYQIEVDGGINDKTALYCKNADIFVAGSYVFGASDYAKAIGSLK